MFKEYPTLKEVIKVYDDNKNIEVYTCYFYYQYKGDNRKFISLEDIQADAGTCAWRLNSIRKKQDTTTNINTAKKYKEFLYISHE